MAEFLEISTNDNRLDPETIAALKRAGHICVDTVVGFDAARARLVQIIKGEATAPQVYVIGLAPTEIKRLGARICDTKEVGYLVARSNEELPEDTPAFTQLGTDDDLLATLEQIDEHIRSDDMYNVKPPETVGP